ncbi:MAG: hypothetical protein HY673_01255 [Chloroflexi bacterium]|nr:hypothetical protein [Chloroflexota bacterium]
MRRWAENHPYRDAPVLSTADGMTFTPMQLVREVEQRTEFGEKQLRVLRHFAEAEKLTAEGLIDMFLSVGTIS